MDSINLPVPEPLVNDLLLATKLPATSIVMFRARMSKVWPRDISPRYLAQAFERGIVVRKN